MCKKEFDIKKAEELYAVYQNDPNYDEEECFLRNLLFETRLLLTILDRKIWVGSIHSKETVKKVLNKLGYCLYHFEPIQINDVDCYELSTIISFK